MRKKNFILSILIVTTISLGFFTLKGFGKDQGSPDGKKDLRVISEKIQEILKNQQDIIARLEDIRKQQDIIRIRASRR